MGGPFKDCLLFSDCKDKVINRLIGFASEPSRRWNQKVIDACSVRKWSMDQIHNAHFIASREQCIICGLGKARMLL
jgi:hypothetical protein